MKLKKADQKPHTPMSYTPNRRIAPKTAIHCLAASGMLIGRITQVHALGSDQRDWRFCRKCQSMFFDGFPK